MTNQLIVNRLIAWIGTMALTLAAWHYLLVFHVVSPAVMASPVEVAQALPRLLTPAAPVTEITATAVRGSLSDTTSTLARAASAFILGILIGVGVGVLISLSREMRSPLEFLLDFVRSIPATALVPVFLVVFGVDDSAKVSVGAFSAALVIALATIAGMSRVNVTRSAVAMTLGIRGLRRLSLLDIPEALPQMFVGLRAGASLALILVIVAEMFIGTSRGLGRVIWDGRYGDDFGLLYAAIIATGVIGYGFNLVIRLVESLVLHWHGR